MQTTKLRLRGLTTANPEPGLVAFGYESAQPLCNGPLARSCSCLPALPTPYYRSSLSTREVSTAADSSPIFSPSMLSAASLDIFDPIKLAAECEHRDTLHLAKPSADQRNEIGCGRCMDGRSVALRTCRSRCRARSRRRDSAPKDWWNSATRAGTASVSAIGVNGSALRWNPICLDLAFPKRVPPACFNYPSMGLSYQERIETEP